MTFKSSICTRLYLIVAVDLGDLSLRMRHLAVVRCARVSRAPPLTPLPSPHTPSSPPVYYFSSLRLSHGNLVTCNLYMMTDLSLCDTHLSTYDLFWVKDFLKLQSFSFLPRYRKIANLPVKMLIL